jgi:hypothetical protein
MVGVTASLESVSPIHPGFTGIILQEKASGHLIACSVMVGGSLEHRAGLI